MAEQARDALAGRDVTVVRSSPLERAVQTAEPISTAFGVDPTTDERLVESANVFEGRTFGVGDGSLRRPSVWWQLRNPFRPSWGEPYADVVRRMVAAIDDVRAAARGHEAVLVSHQLPIEVTRRHYENRKLWHRPDRRKCALASITSLVYDGDQLTAIDYSEPAGEGGRRRVGGA
jgi:broad specificity phosphatase PhoE